ncbi:MAG: Rpn family recombination-promoting nuclease/putative transposase [Acidimicrobiales bacterium]
MPPYDDAMRLLAEQDPARLCAWVLGVPVAGLTGTTQVSGDLTVAKVAADGVFLLPTEPGLVHIEFQLDARPDRIERRLVTYWERLEATYAQSPHQVVVVLRPGGGTLTGSFRLGPLRLDYHVIELWTLPAEALMEDAWLAPLATLAQPPSGTTRVELVEVILERLAQVADRYRREALMRQTLTLANARIESSTLEALLRRFTTMPLDLSTLLYTEGREEGLEQGLEQGLVEGLEQGLVEGRQEGLLEGEARVVLRVLQRCLGPIEDAVMARVRSLSLADLEALADAVMDLDTHGELVAWLASRS